MNKKYARLIEHEELGQVLATAVEDEDMYGVEINVHLDLKGETSILSVCIATRGAESIDDAMEMLSRMDDNYILKVAEVLKGKTLGYYKTFELEDDVAV